MYQPAPAPAYYNGNAERDQAYDQYMKTARSLQNDIRELQRRNNSHRNGRTTYVPFIVPGKETSIIKDGRTDTLYIKDTLLIRDTLFTTDPSLAKMSLAINDSIVNTIASKPDTVFVPVEILKIEKPAVDYNLLPTSIILFGLNKTDITQVYFDRLEYVAGLLLKDSLCVATISGHTDRTGSAKANEIVSLKRANAIKDYLLQRGVAEKQLVIHTFSNSKPVVEGKGSVADGQNRRVEIKLGTRRQ
jgi:outer membrane protein OmpA-like peptidoglycan-associated protein